MVTNISAKSSISKGRREGNLQKKQINKNRWIEKSIIYVLFSCHVLMFCRYLDGLNLEFTKIFLAGTILIILAYYILAILQTRWLLVISYSVFLLIFIFQQFAFSWNNGIPSNINSILAFCTLGSYLVLAQSKLSLDQKTDIIFKISVAYSLLYVVFYDQLFSLGQSAGGAGILRSGNVRGDRLLYALSYGGFALCIIVARFRPTLKSALSSVLYAAPVVSALLIANSRAFTALLIFAIIVRLATYPNKMIARWISAITTLAAIGIAFSVPLNINPYKPLIEDASSRARMVVFPVARDFLMEHPITGIGIPSNQDVGLSAKDYYTRFDRSVDLYASDLSYIGIWLEFGLIGLILSICAIPIMTNGKLERTASYGSKLALRMTGFLMALYAPSFLGGSATMLFGLLLAEHFKDRAMKWPRAMRRIHVGSPIRTIPYRAWRT